MKLQKPWTEFFNYQKKIAIKPICSLHLCLCMSKGRHTYVVFMQAMYSYSRQLFSGPAWMFLWGSRGFRMCSGETILHTWKFRCYHSCAWEQCSLSVAMLNTIQTGTLLLLWKRALFHLEAFGWWPHSLTVILSPLWYVTEAEDR